MIAITALGLAVQQQYGGYRIDYLKKRNNDLMTEPENQQNVDLHADLKALKEELQLLNTHRFVRIHNSLWRLISFQFVRGLAFGLGSVIGATILVSVLVYTLSTIDFIPIVGEWAKEIVDLITVK